MKFEFRRIELERIDEKLTANGGLGTWLEMFDSSPLRELFSRCLPIQTSPRASGSYLLALMQIASFLSGHDCLENLETLRIDPVVEKLFGAPTVVRLITPRWPRSTARHGNFTVQKRGDFLKIATV